MKTKKANKIETVSDKMLKKVITEDMRNNDLLKEFIDTQKKYRITKKARILKQLELEEMQVQLKSGEITMLWYGMPYPEKILDATYRFEVEDYVDRVNKEQELEKKLRTDFNLEDKDFGVIDNGKLINKLKK